jgi:hypothetical protein
MPNNDATPLQPLLAAITIMGSGRLGPTVAALLGLSGTVIGGLALIRSKRRNQVNVDNRATDGRRRATAALVLGLISLVLGGLFLATADGGPGTGNGVVGSGAAVVLGPIAIILGGLTRARSRAAGSTSRVQLASGASGIRQDDGIEAPRERATPDLAEGE